MADGKGYPVVVKLNLPPEKQYHSGHSIIVQGDTPAEVAALLDGVSGTPGHGVVILAQFAEFAIKGGAAAVLKNAGAGGTQGEALSEAGSTGGSNPSSSAPAPVTTDPDSPASDALIAVAAKKSGKAVDELKGISTKEAKALIAAAK